MISVIIPTRNRKKFLADAVQSILDQTLKADEFEVLVVDNGSKDGTEKLIKQVSSDNPRIKYLFAQEPGLHIGRHMGAKNAKGNILVFVDDDIIATQGWLESIQKAFNSSKDVALVGGKIVPKWEADIPNWIDLFKVETEYGWTIGYLSLLDFGSTPREISADFIYGCNYSIQKKVLWECGGFHPDSMPQEFINYRGDGETALSREIAGKGYKVVYEPGAVIYHRVPSERLSIEYFCRRAFNQGVSDSYTEIRKNRGVMYSVQTEWTEGIISRLLNFVKEHPVRRKVRRAYLKGKEFHRKSAEADPEFLNYVLRENYF